MLSTSHKLKNLAGKFLLLSLYYFWNPTSSFLHKTGNSQYEVKWITNCFWKTNQSYTHKTDKSNYQPQISINKIEKYIELNFPHPPKVIIFFKKDFFISRNRFQFESDRAKIMWLASLEKPFFSNFMASGWASASRQKW